MADTETILSFEAGIKTILAENRVRFNLNGYLFDMSDQQITAVGGEFNTATLLNIDKTKGYGLETDIQWTPTGPLADDLRRELEPDRDRRSESDGRSVRWRLHGHRSGHRRSCLTSTATACRTRRMWSSTASSIFRSDAVNKGILRHSRLGLLLREDDRARHVEQEHEGQEDAHVGLELDRCEDPGGDTQSPG